LELLANLGPHVPVIGVKLFEFAGEGVGVGGGEFVGRDTWRGVA